MHRLSVICSQRLKAANLPLAAFHVEIAGVEAKEARDQLRSVCRLARAIGGRIFPSRTKQLNCLDLNQLINRGSLPRDIRKVFERSRVARPADRVAGGIELRLGGLLAGRGGGRRRRRLGSRRAVAALGHELVELGAILG